MKLFEPYIKILMVVRQLLNNKLGFGQDYLLR